MPTAALRTTHVLTAVIVSGVLAVVWALGAVLGTDGPADEAEARTGPVPFEHADGRKVLLQVPAGFVALGQGRRVSLHSTDGSTRIVVSAPDGVLDPADGRLELPTDPVQWLQQHPGLDVSSVRSFRAGGGWGAGGWRGIDGRTASFAITTRTPTGTALSRFVTVPLFCYSVEAGCSRISAQVQVRATFVTGRDVVRPLLVAAYWPRPGEGVDAAMPPDVRVAYRSVLADLARQTVRRPAAQAG